MLVHVAERKPWRISTYRCAYCHIPWFSGANRRLCPVRHETIEPSHD